MSDDRIINWKDGNCKISAHMTVKEALWLPQWNRMANESDGLNDQIKANLEALADVMEKIRTYLGNRPIKVHVCYRPVKYNIFINGAKNSYHLRGQAIDFDIGEVCDVTRGKLIPKLDEFRIRLESNPGSNWLHVDTGVPSPNRLFRP